MATVWQYCNIAQVRNVFSLAERRGVLRSVDSGQGGCMRPRCWRAYVGHDGWIEDGWQGANKVTNVAALRDELVSPVCRASNGFGGGQHKRLLLDNSAWL
jgi:hypothetical protein